MKNNLSYQQTKILNALRTSKDGLSSSQLRCKGIGNVSARIFELRRAGHPIHMIQCFDKNKGKLITKYKLADFYFWYNQ
jgi:hypothetical protein